MMQLTVEEPAFVGKTYGGAKQFAPTEELIGLDNNKGLPMICSRFHDANGKKYWVVVNADLEKSFTANFHLAPDVKLAKYTFYHEWTPISAMTDAVGQMAYGAGASVATIVMAPGQMAVVTLVD